MSGLNIIKASAGSGKTHRLTQEYLALILPDDDTVKPDSQAFRHVLAVTFTNKATDEMKSRVIEELYKLSKQQTLRGMNAKKVLTAILHDYSSFSVSTIDKFFQGVMRSFAREIGQFASYKVELDTADVLNQSVDRLMSSLEKPENKPLLDWLMQYSLEQIESGGRWDITAELKSMAKLFFREDFKMLRRGMDGVIGDKGAIASFREELEKIIRTYREDMVAVGEAGCRAMKDNGVSPEDFKGGGRSPFFKFGLWAAGKESGISQTFADLQDNVSNWFTAKTDIAKRNSIQSAYNCGLNDAVCSAVALLDEAGERSVTYRTALLMRGNLYLLGIFSDLYSVMQEYLKENNTVLLSETSDVLSRIIDGNDTPFVYEKTGTRYDHYMLDEFQDTSHLQWADFAPLIHDSVDQGYDNLIVGDIKQSIYRWRGADLTLLGEKLQRDFGSARTIQLNDNWRSCREIVNFNNGFFINAGDLLRNVAPEFADKVKEYYADSRQEVRNFDSAGHVSVTFLPSKSVTDGVVKDWKDTALEHIGETMERLKKRYRLSDITFLVRKNNEGALVAGRLLELGYDVVTEDSLKISSSAVVRKVVAVMRRHLNPDDRINNLLVSDLFGENPAALENFDKLADSSLYGVCEYLLGICGEGASSYDTPFILAFLDSVLNYESKSGSNLGGFIEWWDSVGSGKSISAPEGSNSVRVMTIHKAKGLKSEAIVIPFLQEPLKPAGKMMPYLWCRPGVEPFSRIGLVPLKASSEMQKTIFADDYNTEMLMQCVDSINTAYVAMTRAVSEMTIFAPYPDPDSKRMTHSVAELLYMHLKDSLDENNCYETGEPVPELADGLETESGTDIILSKFDSVALGDRLKLSLRGGDFYDRKKGIVRHDILAGVDSIDDVAAAVRKSVDDGELPQSESESAEAEVRALVESVADRHWFDGTYRSLNEVSVVDASGNVLRPDRVLVERDSPIGKGGAIVIDYKFGGEHKSYRIQVKRYMSLLKEMGYDNIKGYIWYCTKNSMECVED